MSRIARLQVSPIYKFLWLTLLLTHTSALSLLELLQGTPELSTLYARVNASTNLTNFLASSSDFTLLAPSNAAFASLPAGTANLTDDQFTAMLQYSLLRGGFPRLSLTTDNQFVPSYLNNSNYANVTGGQVVGLALDSRGSIQVMSGNKSVTTSSQTKVCVGGLVHIIDEMLTIPYQAVDEITAAGLEYFVAILAKGNYLTTGSSYVNPVVYEPNITFFIPNSPDALANFTEVAKTASPSELQSAFLYHVIPGYIGYSPMLTDGLSLKTTNGANLTIHVQGDKTYVNAARILSTDYIISNGVVHIIDSVLNSTNTAGPPPVANTTPVPTTSSDVPSSTASLDPSSTPVVAAKSSSGHSSNNTGRTIGIAVGASVAGLLLIASLIFLFIRHRKKQEMRRVSEAQPWNGPVSQLTYEGPTGDPLYANRYRIQKDASSNRYTAQRDSGISQSDSSTPLGIQSQGARFPPPPPPPATKFQRPEIPQRSPSRVLKGGMFEDVEENRI